MVAKAKKKAKTKTRTTRTRTHSETASQDFAVGVTRDGDQHVCKPSPTMVDPGDTVQWAPVTGGGEPFSVFFPEDSPFLEGRGPFFSGERVTVKGKPPLRKGTSFTPLIQMDGTFLKKTKGGVIIK